MSSRGKKDAGTPRPRAVALGYDPGRDAAPKVLAGGAGETARRILEIARERGIPVRQDPGLLEVLSRLDIGAEIPLEVYQAVAEILVFLYRLEASRTAGLPAEEGGRSTPPPKRGFR